ncbi:Hypothetical protein CINCED_3A006181 [Cinara cedri]|uniref:Uncharacterized protein n=1 Tax=Cinara cedri TaxID=506608 RepID=A0A5E4NAR1_9HEMI|nr:Hypothetical protein CINCED_3A006181 [Cinara cedri]
MERFKVMKASGSKHSLNKYYGATDEDVENTAGLLEMTSVSGGSQIDENVSADTGRFRTEPQRVTHGGASHAASVTRTAAVVGAGRRVCKRRDGGGPV